MPADERARETAGGQPADEPAGTPLSPEEERHRKQQIAAAGAAGAVVVGAGAAAGIVGAGEVIDHHLTYFRSC